MEKHKKISIVGRGTAGALTMAHVYWYSLSKKNLEVEWYFDSNTKTQAVGEGTTVNISTLLFSSLGFDYTNLASVDGTIKQGIRKLNWGTNEDFFHSFVPPSVSYHINAVKLQEYIFDKLKDKVKLIDCSVKSEDIDSNYIIDCSGFPKDYDKFEICKYIPVNAAYVTQCYWEAPRFLHTLAIARPYGWVFGIPLQNRCSIGYMFNDKINSVDEVKEDVKEIFEQFNLVPSNVTNELHFNNYYRKVNFTDRIAYNGNASSFLEPLEATTLTGVCFTSSWALAIHENPLLKNKFNRFYRMRHEDVERIIMFHYFAGSKWKTDFWNFAQERGRKCMEEAVADNEWMKKYEMTKKVNYTNDNTKILNEELSLMKYQEPNFRDWDLWSFFVNLNSKGLNIYDKIDALKK